jgi:NSS family neurotransmitter:Na+ symporter
MSTNKDFFSSRWTFLLAAMGMAIGAGNIWRFPRLAGQYGGSFLIPWLIFLFLWSIPLIIIEFSIGKKLRLGVIGAFNKGLGKKYTWMGWFVALCTIGIMFYYSVVCGWSLKYFLMSLGGVLRQTNYENFWNDYTTSNWEPVLFYIISILIGCIIIYYGINKGIEKATKLLIPLLFLLLLIGAIRAITLPGAGDGLKYFFRINPKDFQNYKVWLEALSQSAWSTGAGWGLILTYATYVKKEENIISNSMLTGIGNNLASIICGLAVIPTVFALSASTDNAYSALQSGNQGLTFIYIPKLFERMIGGEYFTPIFFIALFIAALSSLISMLELAVRLLIDYNFTRKISVYIVGSVAVIAGFPSAYSLKFFNNQDWVWGIGLLLSGFFFIFYSIKIGLLNFRNRFLEYSGNSFMFNARFLKIITAFMMVEFIIMFFWWFFQSINWYPITWWHPFEEYTIGTCLLQWGIIILIGWTFENKIAKFGYNHI